MDKRASLRSLLLVLMLLALPACQVHKHLVGGGATGLSSESQRQFYGLFGLWSVNEVDVQRMAADLTGYEVHTEYSLVDFLLMPLLLPITGTSRTITVYR